MAKTPFSVGDVVRLKSGGPLMTVEFVISPDLVNCIWFAEERKLNTYFHVATLERGERGTQKEDAVH